MEHCCSTHLSMDDTFIQWNEILGDPSTSTALVEFIEQKLSGVGGDIDKLIDDKLKEALADLKVELEESLDDKLLEIDPYKINYKSSTVGDALDDLYKFHNVFECKINDLGVYEVGQVFPTFKVSWTMDQDPQSQTILRIRNCAPVEKYVLDPSVREYTFANVTGSEKFVVKGVDAYGENFYSEASVVFKNRLYFGTFDGTSPSNKVITNMTSVFIDKDTPIGRRIFDCENGEYIYFAIPDGLHLTYDFFSNGMKDTNWVYEVKNVTNQYGAITPYRIYRTGNMINGYNVYIEVESHDWY